MNPISIYDQTGKTLTGYPTNITEFQFTLVAEDGREYVFSRDNLPGEKPKTTTPCAPQ